MSINEAIDTLLTIMEAIEDAGGCYNCAKCPFRYLVDISECPFEDCPGLWELRGNSFDCER